MGDADATGNSVRLVCVECKRESDERAVGWRVYVSALDDDEEGEPTVGAYCPECAAREFGR